MNLGKEEFKNNKRGKNYPSPFLKDSYCKWLSELFEIRIQ